MMQDDLLSDLYENGVGNEVFRDALKPKVDGTWNLHTLLPPDVDFFVMLSSASGVTGTRGQAN